MTRANSHYNVWTVCVLYIRQLLLAAGNVSDEPPGGVPYPLSLVEATPSESSEANQDSPSSLASHLLEVASPFLG